MPMIVSAVTSAFTHEDNHRSSNTHPLLGYLRRAERLRAQLAQDRARRRGVGEDPQPWLRDHGVADAGLGLHHCGGWLNHDAHTGTVEKRHQARWQIHAVADRFACTCGYDLWTVRARI